ncbi:hypothetical protein [Oscillatoria sp. HE19RPO]|uniref:hypothetical protein n=1 Tax=Oscillatoria sp. HE19RPO TaxID=2954806 RepID=UPI0020C226E0|nr:hypothetical protein [Oscillatoria sp. HE19RPO]
MNLETTNLENPSSVRSNDFSRSSVGMNWETTEVVTTNLENISSVRSNDFSRSSGV